MCLLSLVNLHNEELNKKLLLLMQSFGSTVHKDGWGVLACSGYYVKSELPANFTPDYGNELRIVNSGDERILGHIRQASPLIPVTVENSHPFTKDSIAFMHNGKLTPKEESKFILTYEVDEEKEDKGIVTVSKKKVKYSDSKIFFDHFMGIMEQNKDKDAIKALKSAMEDFYGKFAFIINVASSNTTYIVKGKTADLHISYLLNPEDGEKVLGYVVHTNKDILDMCGVVLSNLQQLEGKSPVYLSIPKPLESESIYIARKFGIEKVDTIKENDAPATTYYYGRAGTWTEWDGERGTQIWKQNDAKNSTEQKFINIIKNFMREYSLSRSDLQRIFFEHYGVSLLEVDDEILRHFCKKVIQTFASSTTKTYRKRLLKVLGYKSVPYSAMIGAGIDLQFPWMLSKKSEQNKLILFLEKEKDKKVN